MPRARRGATSPQTLAAPPRASASRIWDAFPATPGSSSPRLAAAKVPPDAVDVTPVALLGALSWPHAGSCGECASLAELAMFMILLMASNLAPQQHGARCQSFEGDCHYVMQVAAAAPLAMVPAATAHVSAFAHLHTPK